MSNNGTESFFKGLLLGSVAGVVAGILLAPKSGEETREDIKKLALELKEKAVDIYSSASKEIEKKIAQIKKAGGKIDESKYKALVDEVVEEFKQDAVVTTSVAKELSRQLKADWNMFKTEVSK